MHLRLRSLTERLRASLFLIPTASVAAAVAVAAVFLALDRRIDDGGAQLPLVLASTVESARALLGTIAGATITFAGTAFSVSLLVIQLASSQYSPRVVHTLFRDPFNKRVMGAVVGTFTYCLIVLRSVRSPIEEGGEPIIPTLSVSFAVVLGIAAILAVVAFIDHNAHTMDISEVLDRVTRASIEQVREATPPGDDGSRSPIEDPALAPVRGRLVRFDGAGWVQFVDTEALLEATPAGATVLVHTYAGRYAIEGSPLCTVDTIAADDDTRDAELRANVATGATRTMQQDSSYGLRQLVDVALRALSPGVNDPTTAQDAIFHTAAVLAEALRHPPPGQRRTVGGRTLLLPEAPDHLDLISLAFDEIRRAAAPHPTVCIYVLEALHLLIEATGPDLTDPARDAIDRQAHLVLTGSRAADTLPADHALVADAHRARFARPSQPAGP